MLEPISPPQRRAPNTTNTAFFASESQNVCSDARFVDIRAPMTCQLLPAPVPKHSFCRDVSQSSVFVVFGARRARVDFVSSAASAKHYVYCVFRFGISKCMFWHWFRRHTRAHDLPIVACSCAKAAILEILLPKHCICTVWRASCSSRFRLLNGERQTLRILCFSLRNLKMYVLALVS